MDSPEAVGELVEREGPEIDIERDIRIAIWNACKWQGKPDEIALSLIRKAMSEPTMVRALANIRAALERPHSKEDG